MQRRTKILLSVISILLVGGLIAILRFTVFSPTQGEVKELVVKAVVSSRTATPGDFVTHVFSVVNKSRDQSSYELNLTSPEGWPVISKLSSFSLSSGEEEKIFVTVGVPPLTPTGRYNLELGATSQENPEVTSSSTALINVTEAVKVKVEALLARREAEPGGEVVCSFVVMNQGNIAGSFELATFSPPGWQTTLAKMHSRSWVKLAPGESKDISITVQVPKSAPPGTEDLTLKVSSGKAADEAKVTITVLP